MSITTLPFQSEIIYEAIITTFDRKNKPNAAPMGFTITKEKQVIIRPFKESDTYKNLQHQKACIVNITNDPDLFVKSTLFQDLLTDEFYNKSKVINAPILKACKGNHIVLKVANETEEDERGIFCCDIIKAELCKENVQPYTRAFSSLIEILIHTTRVIHFSKFNGPNDSNVKYLRELIDHHSQIISRVTNKDSQFQKYVEKILAKISQEVGD